MKLPRGITVLFHRMEKDAGEPVNGLVLGVGREGEYSHPVLAVRGG